MRTTITTYIDATLKEKAKPILLESGLSFGVVLDIALKKLIEKDEARKKGENATTTS